MNDLGAFYYHQGTNFNSQEYLGCNLTVEDGAFLYVFRVWAPHADSVCVVSDLFGWDHGYAMTRITEKGIWECTFRSLDSLEGHAYKFRIVNKGKVYYKADPYARYSKGGADGSSLIYTNRDFNWNDNSWMESRGNCTLSKNGAYLPKPINIYEVHLGSFMRHEDNSYYSYREISDVLVPYAKYMGYTHVEFLPLAEYPYDGSWGYQVCGFFAPTSRFGSPDDFKYMINAFHEAGVGVILDWVPAHFPKDAWGLYYFDGEPLYEYQGNDRQYSRSWGTNFFDLGREEIQSFLISNALYFLKDYHIDGLRVDAVASMLYLDYDREPGEWVPNTYGDNRNLEAIAFLQKLNKAVFAEFPDVLMIAEESGDYGKITHSVDDGGLGFNLKWNMGFANDFYDYLMTDPVCRKDKHKALNFPIMYAFSENYVLPISHDEVVHGKKSFIDKMFGNYEDKFAQIRAAMMLIMTYPGKKLTFMGTEYAQFREWDYENSLEWFMLDYDKHRSFRDYVAALNRFYLTRRELWELDFDSSGFEWLLPDENEKNIVAYRRLSESREALTVIVNFSGIAQAVDFKVNSYGLRPMFSSFGEFDLNNVIVTRKAKGYLARITVPAFSGVILSDIHGKDRNKKTLKENKHVL